MPSPFSGKVFLLSLHEMRKLPLIILSLMLALCASAQELPLREFRGAWLHIVGNADMRKMNQDEIRTWLTGTLDSLQRCGCNAVFFQVRPEADAFYISDIEPWTRYLTGTQARLPSLFGTLCVSWWTSATPAGWSFTPGSIPTA